MGSKKNMQYLERALSGIPEDFSGNLLEVPVGTGVLTMPVYQGLPGADITCLDYSQDMMVAARVKRVITSAGNTPLSVTEEAVEKKGLFHWGKA